MATYTIKINERSKAAKALVEMIKNLPFVEIINNAPGLAKSNKESQYDPAFVRKIKKAQKEIERGECTEIDSNDVWGSLGL